MSCSSPILLLLLALSSPCQSVGNERTQPAPLPPLPPSALHCALTRRGRESFPPLFLQLPPKRTPRTHTRDPRLSALFSLVYGRMGRQAMLFSALACLSLKPSILFSFPPFNPFRWIARKDTEEEPASITRKTEAEAEAGSPIQYSTVPWRRLKNAFPPPPPTFQHHHLHGHTKRERGSRALFSPLFWAQLGDHHCSAG